MRLTSGSRIGPYEITGVLGAGGMGEVYRARDTDLGRDVAIKVLPEAFTVDAERRARFEREARVLATLNHPHIAQIHRLEDSGDTRALVLELIEGQTLAQHMGPRGVAPRDGTLRETLTIARQIADALDAAHEKGIVHRDLKPANILITPAGVVKVLDFGLAKTGAGARVDTEGESTFTAWPTDVGTIMGTAPYMSPEQARGQAVDKRTDIWALGCILFEMLTGQKAFSGSSSLDTLAAIIERAPDWTLLTASTPPSLIRLLQRCLEKDPARRTRDAGDVRHELEDLITAAAIPAANVPVRRRRGLWAGGAVAMVILGGSVGWFVAKGSAPAPSSELVSLSIPFQEPPRALPFGTQHLAISEDGSRIAYAGANRVWIRRMDRDEVTAVGNADATSKVVQAGSGSNPFFSPDGHWVGFFSTAGPVKVPVDGGPPVPIAMTTDRPAGATWRADGEIVFATTAGLYQVSERGGEPRRLAAPNRGQRERAYAWPQFVPDSPYLLFTIVSETSAGHQIALLDLTTLEHKIILTAGSSARYLGSGHVLYMSGKTLKAVAFDAKEGQVRGDPVTLPTVDVATDADNGAANFAISATGTLIFTSTKEAEAAAGGPRANQFTLQWVDRQGKKEPLALEPGRYGYTRISPDGTRLAVNIGTGGSRDIWILDLERLNLTQLTNGTTEDMLPLWSTDGHRVFFASDRTGDFDVYSQAADGATAARVELAAPGFQAPNSFTPDGSRLLVGELFKDLGLVKIGQPDRVEPLLHGEAIESLSDVSPDGRWVVYESNESGKQTEIFLRPFPNVNDGREKVSVNGGRFARWGLTGREIFYVALDGNMMAAAVTPSASVKLGAVTKLFEYRRPPPAPGNGGVPYDISPRDGRFIMLQPAAAAAPGPTHVSVVLHWAEELKRLLPRR
jgi:serine/threonine protein kinase/Tol biopolymer transport system component